MFSRKHTSRTLGANEQQKAEVLSDLFKRFRPQLLRFIVKRVKDPTEAEEIIQEAFIRFQNKYDTAEIASPEALLARIASNLVIDRVREKAARAQREQAWGQVYTEGADVTLGPSQSVDPARALSAKQDVGAALQILNQLPQKTRQIFLLHRFEGLSHGEVSMRTGFPKSTIEKHMIKAIKALAVLRNEYLR